jgi:hypothetical protein
MQQNTTTHLSGLNLLIEKYYVAHTQKKETRQAPGLFFLNSKS